MEITTYQKIKEEFIGFSEDLKALVTDLCCKKYPHLQKERYPQLNFEEFTSKERDIIRELTFLQFKSFSELFIHIFSEFMKENNVVQSEVENTNNQEIIIKLTGDSKNGNYHEVYVNTTLKNIIREIETLRSTFSKGHEDFFKNTSSGDYISNTRLNICITSDPKSYLNYEVYYKAHKVAQSSLEGCIYSKAFAKYHGASNFVFMSSLRELVRSTNLLNYNSAVLSKHLNISFLTKGEFEEYLKQEIDNAKREYQQRKEQRKEALREKNNTEIA